MGGAAFLAALQLGDSALPIGRFVHSHGLEAWLDASGPVEPEKLAELVETVVCNGVATLDGALVAHAHRAATIAELVALDACLSARKLTPAARAASQACGRQLAAVAPQLAPDDALVGELAARVRARETDGNVAVVSGTLARAFGIEAREAVLIELRGAATALLSVAVRLGALAPAPAQVALARLAPSLAAAAEEALALDLDELSSTAPELELFALRHARADARMFST
ncbi:MAG: urease accessory protein [Thermoleophilaceae bacterium]|jgi:urease accessory protein|nr:urease accessory protein [Thermoleophilaceae bacterium]